MNERFETFLYIFTARLWSLCLRIFLQFLQTPRQDEIKRINFLSLLFSNFFLFLIANCLTTTNNRRRRRRGLIFHFFEFFSKIFLLKNFQFFFCKIAIPIFMKMILQIRITKLCFIVDLLSLRKKFQYTNRKERLFSEQRSYYNFISLFKNLFYYFICVYPIQTR